MAESHHTGGVRRKSTPRKHGHSFKGRTTREYRIWENMRQRCRNPKANRYDRYGGRGISVCERWDEFSNFLSDMGPCPSLGHSIDRIDNDGNYEPGNCRWATRTEQARNSTRVRLIEYRGELVPISTAVKMAGISPQTFYRRIAEGWSVQRAIDEPAYAKRRKGFKL